MNQKLFNLVKKAASNVAAIKKIDDYGSDTPNPLTYSKEVAQKYLPMLLDVLDNPVSKKYPDTKVYLGMKIPLQDKRKDAIKEYIWTYALKRNGSRLSGELLNTPASPAFRKGQRVEFDPEEVVDWSLDLKDDSGDYSYGYFSTPALDLVRAKLYGPKPKKWS